MKSDESKKALPDAVEGELATVYSLTTIRDGKPTPEQAAKSKLADWTYEWAAKYLHVPPDRTETKPAAPRSSQPQQESPFVPCLRRPRGNRPARPRQPPERARQARKAHAGDRGPARIIAIECGHPNRCKVASRAGPPQPLTESQVFARLLEAENLMASGGSPLRSSPPTPEGTREGSAEFIKRLQARETSERNCGRGVRQHFPLCQSKPC